MNKRRGLFLVVVIFCVALPLALFSYDEHTTHPALTSEMVDLYNASFPGRQISTEEKQQIIRGSTDEDIWPRWINHFYDPVYNQGWTAEGLGTVPSSTGRWLTSILLSDHPPLAAKYWAQSPSTQAEYQDFGGNNTWQQAIWLYQHGQTDQAFYALGHILHLLEDMTVPEHTRNDTHAHPLHAFTGDDGSPYEQFTMRYFPVGSGNTNLPVRAADLLREGYKPILRSTLTAYFNAIATYSNNYFFSKDTVLTPKYALPKIVRSDDNYGYGRDIDGSVFPLVRKVLQRQPDFSLSVAYVLNDVVADQLILTAYFERLSRAAMLNGAGVIELFLSQAASSTVYAPPPEEKGITSALSSLANAQTAYNTVVKTIKTVVPNVPLPVVTSSIVQMVIDPAPVLPGEVLGEKITAPLPVPFVPSGGVVFVPPPPPIVSTSIPLVATITTTTAITTTTDTNIVVNPTATSSPDAIVVTTSTPQTTVSSTIATSTNTVPVSVTPTSTTPIVTSTLPIIVTSTPSVVTSTVSVTTTVATDTSTVAVTSTVPVVQPPTCDGDVNGTILNFLQTSTVRTLTPDCNPYLLAYYDVPAGDTLIIQPGVVIKNAYPDSKMDVEGDLQSNGAIFTSGKATPAAKDWQGIWFHPSSTGEITGTSFMYAGKGFRVNNFMYTGTVSQAIRVEQATVTLTDDVFDNDGDVAIHVENSSLAVSGGSFADGDRAIESLQSQTVLVNSSFTNFSDADGPLYLRDIWPQVSGLDLESNATNVVFIEAATVTSSVELTSDMIYGLNVVSVDPGATLTIDPGTLIDFPLRTTLVVKGTLIAEGTDNLPINFRSLVDGVYWGSIQFDGGQGRFSHVVIEDGSYNFPLSPNIGGMLMLTNSSSVLLDDSLVGDRRSPGNSIYVKNSTLVTNNTSIGQNDKTDFDNTGILVDQGTLSISGGVWSDLTTGIKVVSLPLPTLLVTGIETDTVDRLTDPLGLISSP